MHTQIGRWNPGMDWHDVRLARVAGDVASVRSGETPEGVTFSVIEVYASRHGGTVVVRDGARPGT